MSTEAQVNTGVHAEADEVTPAAKVRAQERVTVRGVIRSVDRAEIGSSPGVRCVLADDSGEVDMLFLGVDGLAGLAAGRRCTATGRACARRGRLVIWNPRYELTCC